ncbi:MAG: hypothetical protein IJW37_04250 [Lachnospiraceae bacterium]|nr:hypothetical protein [Lachnospiraceae bacterium]
MEVDAVICLNDGRWTLIEIKLGMKEIEEGAAYLIELKNKINTTKMKESSSWWFSSVQNLHSAERMV